MRKDTKFSILIVLILISSLIETGISIVSYHNSNNGSWKCTDNSKYVAFYAVKNGVGYCFERQRDYPYRIRGGIIDVGGE